MLKFCKIIFLFWKPLFFWNFIISLTALYGVILYGFGFLGIGLFFKLIGYAGSIYLQYYFASESKYFFLLTGNSLLKMYGCTFTLDFCLYALMLFLYHQIR